MWFIDFLFDVLKLDLSFFSRGVDLECYCEEEFLFVLLMLDLLFEVLGCVVVIVFGMMMCMINYL